MHGVSAGFRKYGRAVTSYQRIVSELPQSPSAVDVGDQGDGVGEHPSILLPEHLVLGAPTGNPHQLDCGEPAPFGGQFVRE